MICEWKNKSCNFTLYFLDFFDGIWRIWGKLGKQKFGTESKFKQNKERIIEEGYEIYLKLFKLKQNEIYYHICNNIIAQINCEKLKLKLWFLLDLINKKNVSSQIILH